MFAPVFLRVYLPPSPPPESQLKSQAAQADPGVLHSRVLTIIPDYHSRAFVKWKGGGAGVLLHCVCGEEFGGEGWRRMEKDLVA